MNLFGHHRSPLRDLIPGSIADPGPAFQFVIVERRAVAAPSHDQHSGGDQLVADMGRWPGVPGPGGDASSLGEYVVAAVSDFAELGESTRRGHVSPRRTAWRCRAKRRRATDPWCSYLSLSNVYSKSGALTG